MALYRTLNALCVLFHLLVSQLLFCYHHLQNMPESFILHFFTVLRNVAEADTSNLPHILGRKLKRVSGTAVKGQKKGYSD